MIERLKFNKSFFDNIVKRSGIQKEETRTGSRIWAGGVDDL